MVGREIVSPELPQRRVQIAHIDYVAMCVSNLNSIADSVRSPHHYVDPSDKTRKGSLQSETEDHRDHAHRHYGRVPVNEEGGYSDESKQENDTQPLDSLQIVPRDCVFDSADQINFRHLRQAQDCHQKHCCLGISLEPPNGILREPEEIQGEQVVERSESDQDQHVAAEPDFVFRLCDGLWRLVLLWCLLQRLPYVLLLLYFLLFRFPGFSLLFLDYFGFDCLYVCHNFESAPPAAGKQSAQSQGTAPEVIPSSRVLNSGAFHQSNEIHALLYPSAAYRAADNACADFRPLLRSGPRRRSIDCSRLPTTRRFHRASTERRAILCSALFE